jgi:uncharacterized protein (TIGR00251 family)
VLVRCWVVPSASRTELKGLHGDSLKIRVAAPPEEGRANAEVCKLLSEVSAAPAELVAGSTNRSKSVLLRGVSRQEVLGRLT